MQADNQIDYKHKLCRQDLAAKKLHTTIGLPLTFRKYEYVYDEYFDCYVCPNNQILKYTTTNRDGYREYKSDPGICESCPYLSQCTQSKNHQKLVTRHIWQDYMDRCEDIRHTTGMKDVYDKRKETIERIFGVAKENHCMRYTQQRGKAKMAMKVGLTFACLNMKKLAKILTRRGKKYADLLSVFFFLRPTPNI